MTDIHLSVDSVIVDDDVTFTRTCADFLFSDRMVDQYHDPATFLANISRYSKKIKIYLDNHFNSAAMTGVEIAAQLYAQGYSRLYLLSGAELDPNEIPGYVVVIRKDDIEGIRNS